MCWVHLLVLLLTVAHGQEENQFARKLYDVLYREGKNLCFSPPSIAWALSAVQQGARGVTAYELATVIGRPVRHGPQWTALLLHQGFHVSSNYTDALRDVEVTTVPTICRNCCTHDCESQVRVADLESPDTVAAINEQVSNATEGHIRQVFSGPLPPGSRMLLLSATYYKGTWQTQFDPSKTYRGLFYNDDGNAVETDLMYGRVRAGFGRSAGVQVLQLRYTGGSHDALIVLPARLSTELLEQVMASVEERDVDVVLPRFRTESTVPLKWFAADLGMPSAFLQNVADFSGITGKRDLYLTDFLHRAAIVVNEEGTEAAAVTALTAALRKRPAAVERFVADRPFLFIVRDASTGLWLFVASVSTL